MPSPTIFLCAYDIRDSRRRERVARVLLRCRLGGQYSVHETGLSALEFAGVAGTLENLIDDTEDRVLFAKVPLPSRCVILSASGSDPERPASLSGLGLVAYDVRERRRLHRVGRIAARNALPLQKSVFLFRGRRDEWSALMSQLDDELEAVDSLRVYPLRSLSDLRFLGVQPIIGDALCLSAPTAL